MTARDSAVEAALRSHLTGGPVLLAVSGGPDSTALMAAAAAMDPAPTFHVATVDHGLRPEAAAEASAVARLAETFGFPHRTLSWIGPKPVRGVQAAARTARYGLLATHAESIGAAFVLTGHTRDDQAETVLMRLLAGSGPAGLAGMRAERRLTRSVRLARPFLHLSKADLVAYCEARGLAFARDPSNVDDRFARARLRQLVPALEREGLSTDRLCRLAARCARDEAALRALAEAAFEAALRDQPAPGLRLSGAHLGTLSDAVLLRVASLAAERIAPGGRERLDRLESLVLDGLRPALHAGVPLRRTLREVLFELTRTGDLVLIPAPPRRARGSS
ncbi:tRNA lysidine(34) synthetase TilS [Methylobacterium sp. Leaf104]|uniref:tRNA lysidine(34) synthetase TilS n=1 Tax=Methylobacterium sp. Leaf104 TaxID=1736254 RepID=UPI0012E8A367|nr:MULTISPECIES: tRNA lysidine(34) synthetase TilS [Methylobacterium]MCI9879484.1 tRNA lysidine(34) synthetase TilS [Methylobacterium goesingense]